ncbi:hypothetical protein PSCICO_50010 [Pseudomonas cichorii]|uniref:Uncharacterized protein n=1 Tax=Pseudomonas serbiensis TaxID=3064350 RepID=A0ABT9CXC1_9PSED|nr:MULTISPECIES: hypothetical protein [Pseudomonas]MDO7928701.1 hypothetical protein [Pseudomonas sp. KFB-138]GFM89602.1 hypothetical protein PSCICO_50010 [Pseudomonas cichorii]
MPVIIAIAVLGSFVLLLVITWLFHKSFNDKKKTTIVFCSIFAIFYGDGILSSTYWEIVCSGAGITVNKSISVEGFYSSGLEADFAEYYLDKGYEYVESDSSSGYVRFSKGEDGELVSLAVEAPYSRYEARRERFSLNNRVSGSVLKVVDRVEGDLIGSSIRYSYRGGYYYYLISRYFFSYEVPAGSCVGDAGGRSVIIEAVPPKNKG